MKVLALTRVPEQPLTNPPSLEVIVDSATVSSSRPLFLPDFDKQWCVMLYPAFKICRLGKDISADFASRYFDSFTMALRLFPVGKDLWLGENKLAKGVLGIYDYCLGFGEWQPWSNTGDSLEIETGANAFSLSHEAIDIEGVIESVSHYTTLKTGDVILPCVLPLQIPIESGCDVSVKVNQFPEFQFKIR